LRSKLFACLLLAACGGQPLFTVVQITSTRPEGGFFFVYSYERTRLDIVRWTGAQEKQQDNQYRIERRWELDREQTYTQVRNVFIWHRTSEELAVTSECELTLEEVSKRAMGDFTSRYDCRVPPDVTQVFYNEYGEGMSVIDFVDCYPDCAPREPVTPD